MVNGTFHIVLDINSRQNLKRKCLLRRSLDYRVFLSIKSLDSLRKIVIKSA